MKKNLILFLLIIAGQSLIGQTWTILNSGTTEHFFGVSSPAPSICYAAGYNGTVVKTTDMGNSWATLVTGTNERFYSICFINELKGFAVGDNKTALQTVDGGLNWTALNLVPLSSIFHYRFVSFLDDTTGFIAGGAFSGSSIADSGVVYKTTDAGISWTQLLTTGSAGTVYSCTFISPNAGYASEYGGKVHKTFDGGNSWTSVQLGTNNTPNDVHFINDSAGFYTTTMDGSLWTTVDSGNTWSLRPSLAPEMISRMAFYDDTTGFAVGGNVATNTATVLMTNNAGATWSPSTINGSAPRLNEVDFNTNEGYAVGMDGSILRYIIPLSVNPTNPIDSATYIPKYWTKLNSGTSEHLMTVCAVSDSICFAGGTNGTILKTRDRGESWISKNIATSRRVNTLYFVSPDTGFALGADTLALKTVDGGENWHPLTSLSTVVGKPIRFDFWQLIFLDSGIGFACGGSQSADSAIVNQSGEVYKTIDGGESWTLVLSTGPIGIIYSVYFTSPLEGYALEHFGFIHKTVDGGNTWTAYPTGTAKMGGILYFTSPTNGVFTTTLGKIQRTTDAGLTWTNAKDGVLPTNIYGVDFYDDKNGFAVTGSYPENLEGSILQTMDGGVSWFTLDLPFLSSSTPGLSQTDVYDKSLGYMVGADGTIIKYDNVPANDTLIILNAAQNLSNDQNKLNIYPNPASNNANIDFSNTNLRAEVRIELLDVFGKMIIISNCLAGEKCFIEASKLASGMYFIRAYDLYRNNATGKFIVD